MGEVTINVNGRPYRMACEDGQEGHLNALGAGLSTRVDELSAQMGQVGDATLLVMAALLISDEASDAADGASNSAAVTAERDALAKELADLRASAAMLTQERDAALQRAAAVEANASADDSNAAAVEASAAEAIERLAGRVAQLADSLKPI